MLKFLLGLLKFLGGLVLALVIVVATYLFWWSGSSHDPINVRPASAFDSPGGPVLIFGGTRGTGLEIAR